LQEIRHGNRSGGFRRNQPAHRETPATRSRSGSSPAAASEKEHLLHAVALYRHRPFEQKVRSDGSPNSVVPESPTIRGGVPHQVGPGRPGRLRWLRRRPCRRRPPLSPARRTERASRTLPVMAVVPVPVRDLAPARVPLITWAPAIGRGRRGLGPGIGAADQSESGHGQQATRQQAIAESNPRSRLLHSHNSCLRRAVDIREASKSPGCGSTRLP
jgi:hypothetical protein